MHIVDTTLFFAPHSGGVRRYLLAKARYLAQQSGVRHTLVVPGVLDREVTPSVNELASPALPFGDGYRFPWRRRAWARKIAALQPDVIEAGDPYGPAWSTLDAADTLGVPAALFAHSDFPRLVESRAGRVAGRLAAAYVARLYARFDLIMAPSRVIARDLRGMGLDRVALQPLGVDGSLYHPARRDTHLRAELGLPENTRLLVFAGRMAREKRIPLLKRAFERLGAPYHLLLVGGESYRRISDRVTLLPFQEDEGDLARLLASADALVHAGDRETFGLVVLEAMACGRPVIVVDSGAVQEIVSAETGLIARANNLSSLCDAIHALYERDLSQMGARARTHIEQHYTWERVLAVQLARYALLTHRQSISAAELSRFPGAL